MIDRTTYADTVEHLLDWLGGNPSDQALRDARRSIQAAYREIPNCHTWTYLYTHGRVASIAPVGSDAHDGIEYTHATRTAVISTGVLPDWVEGALLSTNDAVYRIERRVDDTTFTLDATLNPGADAEFAAWQIARDLYLLPEDFIAADQATPDRSFCGLDYVHPRDWLSRVKFTPAPNRPRYYTIVGHPLYPARMAVQFAPIPDAVYTFDHIYKRRPRPLEIESLAGGTATVASGSTSLSVSTPLFSQRHVGMWLRLSHNETSPTSPHGANPARFATQIKTVTDASNVVLADPADAAYTGVAWNGSDPIDFEQGAMLTAFLRWAENELCTARGLFKDRPGTRTAQAEALTRAKESDSRSFAGRSPGSRETYRPRLRDYPAGPDVS